MKGHRSPDPLCGPEVVMWVKIKDQTCEVFLREDEEPDLTDVADLEREDGFSLGTLSLR